MKIYYLAYRGKPVSVARAYKIHRLDKSATFLNMPERERQMFLAASSRRAVVDYYIFYFAFSWADRVTGFEVLWRET